MGLMSQTVTIARRSSRDRYGKSTFGAAVSSPARFELSEKRRLLPNGDLVIIAGRVFLPADVSVDTDDRLTYDSVNYRVFSVDTIAGGSGKTHHLELDVTRW